MKTLVWKNTKKKEEGHKKYEMVRESVRNCVDELDRNTKDVTLTKRRIYETVQQRLSTVIKE